MKLFRNDDNVVLCSDSMRYNGSLGLFFLVLVGIAIIYKIYSLFAQPYVLIGLFITGIGTFIKWWYDKKDKATITDNLEKMEATSVHALVNVSISLSDARSGKDGYFYDIQFQHPELGPITSCEASYAAQYFSYDYINDGKEIVKAMNLIYCKSLPHLYYMSR